MILDRLRRFTGTDGDVRADYECQGCGTRFEVQRQVCPECGGFSIERVDW